MRYMPEGFFTSLALAYSAPAGICSIPKTRIGRFMPAICTGFLYLPFLLPDGPKHIQWVSPYWLSSIESYEDLNFSAPFFFPVLFLFAASDFMSCFSEEYTV